MPDSQTRFFEERYAAMDSERLIDIQRKGELTPMAEDVLLKILQSRGVTMEERLEIAEDLQANSYYDQIAHLAPLGSRYMARFLDGIFAMFLATVGGFAGAIFGLEGALVCASTSWLLYVLLADALPNGQSLGKRMNQIAVVSDKTGQPCSPFQSIGRNLLLLAFGIIDMAFLMDDTRRRIGDRAAGTMVVKREFVGTEKARFVGT